MNVAQWMFGILMALGIVFVLYSAFLYLISQGNADRIDTARRALTYAIVALVIGVLAGGASVLIQSILGSGSTVDQECYNECLIDNDTSTSLQYCTDLCRD